MPKSPVERFIDKYTTALEEADAALFIGAGFSQPCGFVDWRELMRDIADEVGLDVGVESDLVAVAQYSENQHGGRAHLNAVLIEEFTKNASPSENHTLVANLPIRTIWTTNYDTLIENAFRHVGKRPEVKTTQDNLAVSMPHRDVTIYKMHGDVSQPNEAVLTKDDYESYNNKRKLFSTALEGDLVSKTFLFVGFSFTDPNIDYILSRIRGLLGENRREHYCVMKWPEQPKDDPQAQAEYEYARRKLELRIADLKRYGIQALMVADYRQMTDILRELNRRSRRKNIFVSGSAHVYDPLGRERVEGLARLIGQQVIRRGYNLVSGFGLGIGGSVIIGASETVHADPQVDSSQRLLLRPFPQDFPDPESRRQFWTKYRHEMISNAGFTVFLCGNKADESTPKGGIAEGVMEEFQISGEVGAFPIPIGATGYAAREIWNTVMNSLDGFYPNSDVRKHFEILGDEQRTNQEYVDAVFAIAQTALGS